MATGDIKWFSQALEDLGNKIHNINADTLKLGIVTSATTPLLSTAAPHWGGTGTTNFATNQVGTGGTSYTGPQTLQISSGGGGSQTWAQVSNVPTLRADAVVLAQDASGFTNGRWGIIYNDTDANKRAIAFVDLGSDRSLVTGSLTIDWSGANNDILTITQS
jgi:hypothetical protein